MKKSIFILYLFIFSSILQSQPMNQYGWQWLNPQPTNNYLYRLRFIDLNTGYAIGDNSTIIKSTNGGVSWAFQPTWDVNTILKMLYVFNKDTIITGGYWGKLYKTVNGGQNWALINTGTQGFLYGICFINNVTGYIVSETGLLKTTTGGDTWTPITIFPTLMKLDIKFIDQNTGFIIGQKLIKTTNGGSNWDTIPNTTFQSATCMNFLNASTGFVGGAYLYRSINGGVNWDTAISGIYPVSEINFINQLTGWVATGNSVYKTTNSGTNWSNLNVLNGALSVNFINDQTGYLSSYSSIISKTTNGGTNWYSLGTNMVDYSGEISCISFLNVNTGFLSGGTPTQFRKTTNGGLNWTTLPYAGGPNSIRFFNENTGYAAFGGVSGTGIIKKTTNGGLNWTSVQTPQPVYSLFFIDINTGFGEETRGIVRTSDAGQTWQEVLSVSDWVNSVYFADNFTGYAVGTYLYKSTNSGLNWVLLPGIYTSGLSIYFVNPSTGYIGSGGPNNGSVSKTTNGGNNWVLQNSGFLHGFFNIQFFNENSGIASGYHGEFISTTNGGMNWQVHYYVTNSNFYGMQFFDMNTGYLCGSGGILLKTTDGGSILHVHRISAEVPDVLFLSQNYPNPFNPATVIKYQVASYKLVKLTIYDALGREVATLVNQVMQPGSYSVDWDASNYPSGVYFYKLEAGDYTQTKKMVLIK
jgi:photosystem II stability/assembly factor-like uncharacterized protein